MEELKPQDVGGLAFKGMCAKRLNVVLPDEKPELDLFHVNMQANEKGVMPSASMLSTRSVRRLCETEQPT